MFFVLVRLFVCLMLWARLLENLFIGGPCIAYWRICLRQGEMYQFHRQLVLKSILDYSNAARPERYFTRRWTISSIVTINPLEQQSSSTLLVEFLQVLRHFEQLLAEISLQKVFFSIGQSIHFSLTDRNCPVTHHSTCPSMRMTVLDLPGENL